VKYAVAIGVAVLACSGSPAPATPPPAPAATSKRLVLEPEAVVMVLSEDQELSGPRPISASLGATVGPRARILLKLPKPTWTESLVRAWLVLDRADFAQAGPSEVTIHAEKIVEPWSAKGGAGTTWASPPRSVAIDGASVSVPARGAAPIRIDITSYVEMLTKKGERSWGLRIEGSGKGYGVPIATGFGKGLGPRVEVYVQ
jgi:hypothetical protein